MKNNSTKFILFSSIALLFVSLIFSVRVINVARQNQVYQMDLAEISSIRYGILNVDEWEKNLALIITKKVNDFELTPENQEQLKIQLENILYRLLDEVNKILRNDIGRIKQFLMSAFVDLDQLRENVPELSETLLEELVKPENKENIEDYILQKLNTFVDETFNKDTQQKLNALLLKYECVNKEDAAAKLEQLSNKSNNQLGLEALLLIVFLLGTYVINAFTISQLSKSGILIILITSIIFLANGISIPMINIEAKISRLTFQLLGENIVFENQVLFFQSKSILDVVWILISTWKTDMIFVGVLIFIFSILFPFTKLTSSYLMVQYPKKYKENKWLDFFTFRSGKWSMADVFVVALFMAFIGFNGIIGDQLSHFSQASENIEILTTNGTKLQVGFYLFLLFCIVSLYLSDLIHKMLKTE